jgi:hypothetical protein
LATAVV